MQNKKKKNEDKMNDELGGLRTGVPVIIVNETLVV